jgi:SpoVK/Ycf46/Vps4 family AAA+-type ATPase
MEILKIHASKLAKHGDIDYEAVVKLAEGFNGADLRNICTEAGMFAIRDERDYTIHEDFMKVVGGGCLGFLIIALPHIACASRCLFLHRRSSAGLCCASQRRLCHAQYSSGSFYNGTRCALPAAPCSRLSVVLLLPPRC